jgi:hypothetical protein
MCLLLVGVAVAVVIPTLAVVELVGISTLKTHIYQRAR